jgi:hypothetical protein
LLEAQCESGVDFAGHVAGSRFVMLMQSEDWRARAARMLGAFPALLDAHVSKDARARGYFTVRRRDGRDYVRPMPKLVIGSCPCCRWCSNRGTRVVAGKRARKKKRRRNP